MILPKDFWIKRPLSWSQLSSFEYNPEQWFASYMLNEKQSSREMTFGSVIDKRFQNDPTFYPEISRGEHMQFKLTAVVDGIPLVGFPDILAMKLSKLLADLKTGKKLWDQKRADETGQLDFYLLLIWEMFKMRPEEFDLYIHWLQTQDNADFSIGLVKGCKPVSIRTKRTMVHVLKMRKRIATRTKEMKEYVKNHE